MQTFTNYPDSVYPPGDTVEPRAVRLLLCDGAHVGLTFADDCNCNRERVATLTRYAVIGCAYGKLHDTSGGWRLWKSASPAYRAAREYVEF